MHSPFQEPSCRHNAAVRRLQLQFADYMGSIHSGRPSRLRPAKRRAMSNDRIGGLSQEAVAALIEQNFVGLRLLVARRCHDPHVAADLLNEAVVTTWSKWQAGM